MRNPHHIQQAIVQPRARRRADPRARIGTVGDPYVVQDHGLRRSAVKGEGHRLITVVQHGNRDGPEVSSDSPQAFGGAVHHLARLRTQTYLRRVNEIAGSWSTIEAQETRPPHIHIAPLPACYDAGGPFQRAGHSEAAQKIAPGARRDHPQRHPRRYRLITPDEAVHHLVRGAIAAHGNDHLVPPHSLSRQPRRVPRRLREGNVERRQDSMQSPLSPAPSATSGPTAGARVDYEQVARAHSPASPAEVSAWERKAVMRATASR